MKSYPSYKDSGVEWIGEVPSGWDIKRMCYVFKTKSIKNTYNERNLSVYRDYGVIPTDSRDDNHNVVSEDISNYKLVDVGDFVMNKMQCWMGSLGLSDYRGIVSPSYTVMEPLIENHHKYTHYLLRSKIYIPQYKRLSYGVRVGQWDLRFEDFRELPCLIPPLEQQQISNYLDHKTGQIDTLIEKTQQKIELLKEQRTSLINRIVTKGLNPNVEMKDSGVEWIGGIPVHWISTRIKYYLYEVIDTEHKTVTFYDNGDYSVVRTTNIKNGKLVTDGIKKTNYDGFLEWTRRGIPSPGDVLLTREGPVGECCIVPSGFDFCMGQRVVWLKVKTKELVPQLLVHAIYSEQSKLFMDNISLGSTLSHLNMSEIGNIPIFIPPFQEQQQIVDYLDKETTKIDTLIEKENQRIDLLKEYRQSLISEVVTGKVDVRDEVFV